ncbi:hypothetical protein GQX73_g4307 [Xylaria multiplex]|uniref:Protein kinase domain-containing protein n=1 Tax=Xylaria multiplex TaxID=323545 RepID=A0A7C8IPT6_9PEZI|nr:hypothetical protein GQX73_g4307 [Xylaria multiplex]
MPVACSSHGNEVSIWPSWSGDYPTVQAVSNGTIWIPQYGVSFCTGENRPNFYPLKLLRHIFTKETVSTEIGIAMKNLGKGEREDLVKQVLGQGPTATETYIQIFATLKAIGQLPKLPEFVFAGVSDRAIPLYFDLNKMGEPLFSKESKGGNFSQSLPDGLLDDRSAKIAFTVEQHNMNVPFFGNQDEPYNFPWDQVLPIRKITPDEASTELEALRGSYGRVSKIQIHPMCHSFEDVFKTLKIPDGGVYFAQKQFLQNDEASFRKEVEMLRRFHNTEHPHIVTLLASYKHQNERYLIFPWATHDLGSYWEKVRPAPDPSDPELVRWVCKQLWNLSDAVRHIHSLDEDRKVPEDERLYGRHGDLKAENILWYKSETGFGNLVITDMGLSKTHRFESRTYVPKREVMATPRYRPPEVEYENGIMGRTFDIWTLGCIFLEFLCWLHRGFEGLQGMENDMMAPSIRKRSETNEYFEWVCAEDAGCFAIRVKKVVTKLIETLRSDCSEFTYNLLDIIEHQMLVVDRNDRISAVELAEKMRDLDTQCEGRGGVVMVFRDCEFDITGFFLGA